MSERKTKIRYDYNLLKKYCEENGLILHLLTIQTPIFIIKKEFEKLEKGT